MSSRLNIAVAIALLAVLATPLLSTTAPLVSAFSGSGSGTPEDPYIITTVEQLQEMKDNLTAHYALGNDIDASDTGNWNGGAGFEPVGTGTSTDRFSGSFDGRGHVIENLYINRSGTYYQGLFGSITGTVENVGLVGENVTGSTNVGGLVGLNYGTVSNSYSTGSVSGSSGVGGLVGYNYQGTVSNSYSTGSVSGGADVGGLVGLNARTVSNSYSTGSVSGTSRVGGLVGVNYIGATVSNSYSTGSVSGSEYVGGLVGWNYGTVSNSFWDVETSGRTTSDGGIGKTTAEMKTRSTFTDAGWDFTNVWDIDGVTNDGYPFLAAIPPTPKPADDTLLIAGIAVTVIILLAALLYLKRVRK